MNSIIQMLTLERSHVTAIRRIYPNPLESDGRIVERGETGEIQDEADGFLFVEFPGHYIAMVDPSEVR